MPRVCPKVALLWLFFAMLLTGCGQKGPLYLPQSPTQPTPSEQPSTVKP